MALKNDDPLAAFSPLERQRLLELRKRVRVMIDSPTGTHTLWAKDVQVTYGLEPRPKGELS